MDAVPKDRKSFGSNRFPSSRPTWVSQVAPPKYAAMPRSVADFDPTPGNRTSATSPTGNNASSAGCNRGAAVIRIRNQSGEVHTESPSLVARSARTARYPSFVCINKTEGA